MTENSSENDAVLGGNAETPNSANSQGNGNGTSGEQVVITKAEWDSLQKTVKTLQNEDRSKKDKAVKNVQEQVGKLEERITPLLERAAQYMQKGDSIQDALQKANSEQEDAETRSALRDMARAWKSGELHIPGTGNTETISVETTAVFDEFKVDPNSPEALPLLNLKGVDLVKGVAKLALKSKTTVDSSTATGLVSPPAKTPEAKDLTEKYKKEMLSARGNRQLLAEIRNKYSKQGVDVYNVEF